MPEHHRRERAIELHAQAVAPHQPARQRVDALALLAGQLLVEARAAADRLEAQELQLVEAEAPGEARHGREPVERAAAHDAVDPHLGLDRAQPAQRLFGVAEPVEAARAAVGLADAVDADVDLAEHRAAARGFCVEPEAAGGQIRRDAHRARVLGDGKQVVQLQRLAPISASSSMMAQASA